MLNRRLQITIAAAAACLISFNAMAGRSYKSSYASRASSPYFGVEAIQTNQDYKRGYGKKIFKKNPQNYAVFIGFNFVRCLGMEFGYEMQPKRNKVVTLRAGDTLPGGGPFTGTNTRTMQSSIRSNHPYVGIFGECKVRRTKYNALFAVSASHVKASHSTYVTSANLRTYKKTKVVPMVKLSVTQNLSDCLGVRLSLNYRNMQRFKIYSQQTNSNQIRLRDAFGVGLGVTYSFN